MGVIRDFGLSINVLWYFHKLKFFEFVIGLGLFAICMRNRTSGYDMIYLLVNEKTTS